MPERDYYEVLGVSRKATPDEVKRAYRKLAKKYHPDRNRDDKTAEARFKEVQAAYDVLGDSQKRKLYDQFGPAGISGGAPGGWRSGPSGQRVYTWKSGGGPDIPIEDLDDLFSVFAGEGGRAGVGPGENIFDQFFGQSAGRRQAPRGQRAGRAAAGGDIEHPVTLTFEQAIEGATLEITVAGSGGSGGPPKKIAVKIPAGVADGQRIRLRGKGQAGGRGARPGDLYIVCKVQAHRYFRRVGNDIYLDLPLTITEAALGTKLEIPTLGGETVLTVPAGTPSGAKLRLKNQGVKPAGKKPRGHQYAVVRVVPPKSLTPRQRELLEQFRQTGDDAARKDVGWQK